MDDRIAKKKKKKNCGEDVALLFFSCRIFAFGNAYLEGDVLFSGWEFWGEV